MRKTILTMLRVPLATALASLLLALPLSASAAGLGKITVLSALGQPLRAEIDISATREELSSFNARLASAAAFQQAGIEYSNALAGIRFSIGQRPGGQPILTLASDRAFSEPFLDLLLEATWSSGRLLREYTFLLDPPEAQAKATAPAATPVHLPESRKEAATEAPAATTAPPVAPVQAQAPATTPATTEIRPAVPAATVDDKGQKKPPAEMQVVRGADGVQRIVRADAQAAEKHARDTATRTRAVKQGDTLGKIAAETKPDGVNLDQMLVALFRSNEEAFVGNVNRLKSGKILNIPDRDTVAGISAEEAKTTILAHAADFNAYSKKLASSVAGAESKKDETSQRAASGKIAPKVEEKAPVAAGKDKLEVSKSDTTAADKAGATRLAAIEETLVSREKALKDANSRIAELEKNLADLKRLIELKNQSMADLQKQAQAATAPAAAKEPQTTPQKPAAKEVEKPAPTPDKSAGPTPAQATPAQPAKPDEPAPPAVAEKPATTDAPAPPKPAAEPIKPVVEEKKAAPPPPAPPPPPPSFIDDSPEIVYGGSAIVLLLLGYLGYSNWRKKKAAQATDDLNEPLAPVADAGSDKAEPEELLSPTDFSSQPSGAPPSANVDPVAEAEVYMAYGRDAQAEEILVDALKSDPTRLAIHLKLLEIYAARKSVNQFDAIALDVHGLTNGEGSDWEKTRQMGLEVNPENPLYGGGQEVAQAEFDPEATMAVAQPALVDSSPAEEEPLQDFQMAEMADVAPQEPAVEEAPAEEAPQEDVPVSLDFDFDLPLADQVTPPAESDESGAPAEPSAPLDVDLGAELGSGDQGEAPAAQEAAPSLDIDFDLDLDATPVAEEPALPPAEPAAENAPAADAGLDFNFDLDTSLPEAPVEAEETPVDAGGIDLDSDLELPAATAETPAASKVDLSSINLDLDAPLEPTPAKAAPQAAQDDDSAYQDVATKLELAQAYEEMGDREGARELLQEVLTEGNAAQKETARNKLAQLG